jgi:hypothetical protein
MVFFGVKYLPGSLYFIAVIEVTNSANGSYKTLSE